MSVLTRVETPQDLKKLSLEELGELSAELREFIIHHVSQTGGHLASSLGAAEPLRLFLGARLYAAGCAL